MYAIVEVQGHQYIVQEGDVIQVDRMADHKEGDKVSFDVLGLFTADGKDVKVGAPTVSSASVSCEVVDHVLGDKLHVYKFKRKNRYSRKMGFRAQYTNLSIKTITA